MKIYVVHQSTGGYAREDNSCSRVVGTYTDAEVARKVALIAGLSSVAEVELDHIPPGYEKEAVELGIKF
jgi:hypothetical protein